MAAFFYLQHPPEQDAASLLTAMSAPLAPPEAKGNLREFKVPGGTMVVWTASFTPFDFYASEDGSVAMILGEALCNDRYASFTAEQLHNDWLPLTNASGFFCWLVIRSTGEMIAGADPFGLFPLYHSSYSTSFALATSIAVLRQHPDYDSRPDWVGLARHLIENGCTNTRTVERGSQRLQTGYILQLTPGQGNAAPLMRNHSVNWLSDEKITKESTAVDLSIDLSNEAYLRHTHRDASAMLMSGGLDTRQLVALAIRNGHRPHGYTYGRSTDFEAELARRTCRKAGGKWDILPDSIEDVRPLVRDELTLLSLAGGFSTVTLRGSESLSKKNVFRCSSGLMLDVHYSPMYLTECTLDPRSFDFCMDMWINRFGIPSTQLVEMSATPDMREAVLEALSEIRNEWNELEGELSDVHWQVILRQRMRPHLGSHLWKSSFFSWQQLIGTDVNLVKGLRKISGELKRGRHLQRQTMLKLSPGLAKIPLERMSNHPQSLLPSKWNPLHDRLHSLRLYREGKTRNEAHRYPRLLDVYSPPWMEIRKIAEKGRPGMNALFQPEALKEFIPVFPGNFHPERVNFRSKWGIRLGLGAMCWFGQNRT